MYAVKGLIDGPEFFQFHLSDVKGDLLADDVTGQICFVGQILTLHVKIFDSSTLGALENFHLAH